MDLTLINFESEADLKIVARGRGYWEDGHVDTPEEREEGDWVAFVQGTDAYEVRVSLIGGQTTRYRCTCPYDLGPVCKHVISVLYALRERLPEYAPENASDFAGTNQDERARSGKSPRKHIAPPVRADRPNLCATPGRHWS
jgi:uncharacterized Zn finger protein